MTIVDHPDVIAWNRRSISVDHGRFDDDDERNSVSLCSEKRGKARRECTISIYGSGNNKKERAIHMVYDHLPLTLLMGDRDDDDEYGRRR